MDIVKNLIYCKQLGPPSPRLRKDKQFYSVAARPQTAKKIGDKNFKKLNRVPLNRKDMI